VAFLVPALAVVTLGVGPAAADPAPGVPAPPPVDMDRLPADTTPTALPGLRQTKVCARPAAPDTGSVPALLWGQRSMRLPDLHRVSRGAAVRIAVIDSGVARHPLLAGRLIAGGDYVAGGNGLADCEGHGTAVAGIAAAAADPGSGFAGVAPQAEVIAIRQTSASFVAAGPDGTEVTAGDTTTLAKAVVRAVDLGAKVINISEVACVPAERAAAIGGVLQAAVHHAAERDVVVVVAAGNRGSGGPGDCPAESGTDTLVLPAWYDEDVLAVASLAPDGSASQFGIRAPWVDVAAPGERVASLGPVGGQLTDRVSNPDVDVPMQGTSFAAPAVAGLAALIRARYPRLTARQVIDRITATADRREAGRSVATGWGAVDAEAALTRTPVVLGPPNAMAGPRAAGTGLLPLPAAAPDRATGPAAVWGGVLALVAAVAAAGLAVLRSRGRSDPHH
jgi:membrane-anchored mycosin MYCP